jgi:hypothetical protein
MLNIIIRKVHFTKVLIDEGSALKILFTSALTELGLSKEDLIPLTPFLGIVPGRASQPLGEIMLLVQFGIVKMFCTEYVNFLVVDFDTTYHAILGRLALTKFMAILHYSYLVLKMPAPEGVLTLQANLTIVYTYEMESLALAEAIDLFAHMEAYLTES